MQEQLDRIEIKLAELEGKVDEAITSSQKVSRYLRWGFWITVGAILIPLFILPLFLPAFFASQGLGGGL